uniref:Ciliary microtubule inner protein 2A-C-like domain-containing protein n=1 Tax=Trichogramma kaykai TaxID=54128 RepID=A0ABD2WMN7_9HYME
MVGVEILQQREPYYIPGYTGYCPQHRFICGKTFGHLSHDLLLDPDTRHAEKLALSDRSKNFEVRRPKKADIQMAKSKLGRSEAVYNYPVLSSYEGKPSLRTQEIYFSTSHMFFYDYLGHIPCLGQLRDRPKEVQAIKGIASFKRKFLKEKAKRDDLRKVIELQTFCECPNPMQETLLTPSKYVMPVITVRPDRAGKSRYQYVNEKYVEPKECCTSPYFMNTMNPEKYFVSGFTGHIPNRWAHFGKTHKQMSSDGLRDFTSKYLHKKMTDWKPLTIADKRQDEFQKPLAVEIYQKNTPILPKYTGHVPGFQFSIGKTYGTATKAAHHTLEEHLFSLKMNKCNNQKHKK